MDAKQHKIENKPVECAFLGLKKAKNITKLLKNVRKHAFFTLQEAKNHFFHDLPGREGGFSVVTTGSETVLAKF